MRPDPPFVKALARSLCYQKLPDEGRYFSVCEMVAAKRLDRGYMGLQLWLTPLAADLIESILGGHLSQHLVLSGS